MPYSLGPLHQHSRHTDSELSTHIPAITVAMTSTPSVPPGEVDSATDGHHMKGESGGGRREGDVSRGKDSGGGRGRAGSL